MNDLKIFESTEFGSIRTVMINEEPHFVGKDVADILEYTNTAKAIRDHVDDEDKLTERIVLSGQNREVIFINESGLHSLILSSKMPAAKKFKRWVTSEVLPAIRKHGMYATDELLNNPDLAIKAFTALKEEREKNKLLTETISIQTEKIEADKPKVLFADAVATSKTSILIGDLAKILKQNGVNIGQKRLFEWLRQNGYLIKSGNSKNMPTQRAMEMELFEIKETTISNPDGSVRVTRTTKVTGKGQQYFINIFLCNKKEA